MLFRRRQRAARHARRHLHLKYLAISTNLAIFHFCRTGQFTKTVSQKEAKLTSSIKREASISASHLPLQTSKLLNCFSSLGFLCSFNKTPPSSLENLNVKRMSPQARVNSTRLAAANLSPKTQRCVIWHFLVRLTFVRVIRAASCHETSILSFGVTLHFVTCIIKFMCGMKS